MTDPRTPVSLDALLAHRDWVRAVARRLVADENDADDVEQQTWLLALERPPLHAGAVRGWLGAAARNVARKLGRSRSRRARHEAHAEPAAGPSQAADLVAQAELQQRIGRAVLDLDEPFRATVLLRWFEGLPPSQVAARMGVPVETVRSRLRTAHERIRGRLDRDPGGNRAAWAALVLAWDPAPRRVVPLAIPAAAAGGVALSLSKKVALACLLLFFAGAATWHVATPPTRGAASDAADAVIRDPAGPGAVAQGTAKRASPALANADAPSARGDDPPPPVDLDRCDRDLDLHGTVVDALGAGLPGARVTAVQFPWRAAEVPNVAEHDIEVTGPSARTARDGTFSLRLARGQTVALRADAEGFAPVELRDAVAGGRVRIVLRPGVRLVARVVDADGAPLAGAIVRAFPAFDPSGTPQWFDVRATTGSDGVGTLDRLPPRSGAHIEVRHPSAHGGWARVELPGSGELRTEIRTGPARTLAGHVIDAETRRPIAGARIGIDWTLDAAVTSRADGAFELPGWTGVGVSTVHVRAAGYARAIREVRDAGRLDFELTPGYAVSGRVIDADERPVAGAHVSLIATAEGGGDVLSDGSTTTDAQGAFRVAGLHRGMRHVLVAAAPGHGRIRRMTPAPASARDDVDLGAIALPSARRVEGEVAAADGSPLAGVGVLLSGPLTGEDAGNEYGRTVNRHADDLGRFRFDGVGPGRYALVVHPAGGQEIRTEIEVAADADVVGLRIRLHAVRRVTITVTDARSAPLAGTYLYVTTASGIELSARTGAEGRAVFEPPAGLAASLAAEPVGPAPRLFLPTRRDLRVDETDVAIVLAEAAAVRGRVLDPAGAPVPGAWLRLEDADGTPLWTRTNADGHFETVAPVDSRIRIVFDGTVSRDGRLEDSGLAARLDGVAAGSDVVLRSIEVARDRTLTVHVVSPQDEPVPLASVSLAWSDGITRAARADAEGRATFSGLPAREMQVRVQFERDDFLPPVSARVTPTGQEVRLVSRGASRTTGTLADAAGTGIAKARVRALRDGRDAGSAVTAADGTFTLLLPAGDVAPVRLVHDRDGDDAPEASLDAVLPGTSGVQLVAR